MKLTNDSYIISMGTKNFTEKYFRDKDGWVKISATGREFRMTPEQLLNHLLPAIAGVKPNLTWSVEYKHSKKRGATKKEVTLLRTDKVRPSQRGRK